MPHNHRNHSEAQAKDHALIANEQQETSAESYPKKYALILSLLYAITTGALVLKTAWWIFLPCSGGMIAFALVDYRIRRRIEPQSSLRQDPYSQPQFTKRFLLGISAILWPQVAAIVNDVVPQGLYAYIAAVLVGSLCAIHAWWAVTTGSWNYPNHSRVQ